MSLYKFKRLNCKLQDKCKFTYRNHYKQKNKAIFAKY